MRPHRAALAALVMLSAVAPVAAAQSAKTWRQHDPDRPRPPIVTPGRTSAAAPSDAIVLFDGSTLDAWRDKDGRGPARWVVREGFMEAAPGTGAIQTAMPLGDVQLHVEWSAPTPVKGRGQGRGNSGVILMGLYEVQILDSFDNTTYADGQAAAAYGQYPPLVNASRPPGEWQAYDIVFRGPRWDAGGALVRPARLTVLHNGVVVQDHVSLWGGTAWLRHAAYAPHAERLPLVLQDHSNPVRFRNIWARALPDERAVAVRAAEAADARRLSTAELLAFVGTYRADNGESCRVVVRRGALGLVIFDRPDTMPLASTPDGQFTFRHTSGAVRFTPGAGGKPSALDVSIAEVQQSYTRVP